MSATAWSLLSIAAAVLIAGVVAAQRMTRESTDTFRWTLPLLAGGVVVVLAVTVAVIAARK